MKLIWAHPRVAKVKILSQVHTLDLGVAAQRLGAAGAEDLAIVDDVGVEQRRTTGKQLTWFADNDKLIVDGEEKKPAVSNLQRKR